MTSVSRATMCAAAVLRREHRYADPPVVAVAADSVRGVRTAASSGSFLPLHYNYLLPIRLNVAAIQIEQRFMPVRGTAGCESTRSDAAGAGAA